MTRKTGVFGLLTLLGLLAIVLFLGASGWAQKKPPSPPPPPADPAIAFVAWRAWSTTSLMVMNEDGSNQKVLVASGTGPTSIGNHDPNWSPDGNRIAFFSNIWGNGIYIINKDGTGLCKVVAMNEGPTYGAENPQWSPDGLKILYSDSPGPGLNTDLYLVDATCNAGPPINLTNSPDDSEFYPTWSPDCSQLAAQVYVGEEPDIWLFDVVDGNQGWSAVRTLNITANGPLADAFVFSPDWAKTSGRIAVHARLPNEDTSNIWVIDLRYPDYPTNLTRTPALSEREPSWSPLDTQIVYSCNDRIYVMNDNGSDVKLIASSGKKQISLRAPDWRHNP